MCLAVAEANRETRAKPGSCKAIIPATWEAEAEGSQLQGLPRPQSELNLARHCLQLKSEMKAGDRVL